MTSTAASRESRGNTHILFERLIDIYLIDRLANSGILVLPYEIQGTSNQIIGHLKGVSLLNYWVTETCHCLKLGSNINNRT